MVVGERKREKEIETNYVKIMTNYVKHQHYTCRPYDPLFDTFIWFTLLYFHPLNLWMNE